MHMAPRLWLEGKLRGRGQSEKQNSECAWTNHSRARIRGGGESRGAYHVRDNGGASRGANSGRHGLEGRIDDEGGVSRARSYTSTYAIVSIPGGSEIGHQETYLIVRIRVEY